MGRDHELLAFVRKLRAQYDHFNQTIQILFGSISSDTELATMMADPQLSKELWKSKEMALRDRLQDAYTSYQTIMEEVEIKILLDDLDECNRQLERFTEKSKMIETCHKPMKPVYATRVHKLQRYAKALHESLAVCWSCSCKSSHMARLQLEARDNVFAPTHQKMFPSSKNSSKTSFNVTFSTVSSDENGVPWSFQAAEICVDDEEDAYLSPMGSPKPNKMGRNASFQSLPPYTEADPANNILPTYEEVKDLCASIQQVHKSSSTIGFSLDSKQKLRGAYVVDTREAHIPSAELVSLGTLLERPPLVNGRRSKLSRKDRFSLALTLASSALYLNSTPWLHHDWTARDVLFHRTTDATRPVDLSRPYLSPTVIEGPNNGLKGPNKMDFQNSFLLALAVALLELHCGTTAERYEELELQSDTTDAPNHQSMRRLLLVHSWMQNEAGDLSAAYQGAITHCMKEYINPNASLQNADCLQAAVENIVIPLQEELDQFLGKKL
ncbi:uncharacterized protein J4E88_010029 [Alternaria novae-zelandiae]|uniref:uncharacterized protein n=1 Tax=Alternaria novae-zelandiae TaxID=430562 RepID=UPI0020C2A8A7|nr:uncharacterized protein J4E88_010029 [Alternaria novae-zelandiae]KAI4667779.1 hypothetical protein J4E88_010029 [Alternaria novae-zelandiae]